MSKYLIKTDKEEEKTQIIRLGNPTERIGLVYTDFLVKPGTRDITKEEIVDPETNKSIGQVRLHKKDNLAIVTFGGKEIAAITSNLVYRENGMEVPIRRYCLDELSSDKYSRLIAMGLDHAYSLGDRSQISHVFCFIRGNNLAAVVSGRNGSEGIEVALKGLALSVARRVESQDYLFDFLR